MIATILTSSASFHSVEYNEMKVSQGKAELLEKSNLGPFDLADSCSAAEKRQYLMEYSRRNKRIKNPQFHVAISCKGKEYSFAELVEIAHRYLHEMGYDDPGQPLLIYGHHDTENNHIHIITSRVAPDGHKINHKFERKRSLEAINRVMGVNADRALSENVAQALTYRFETVAQFRAILESEGYETEEKDDKVLVRQGGDVVDEVALADIQTRCTKGKEDDYAYRKRLRALLLKYRDHSANKEDLNDTMHRLFGVCVVFVGKKDSPYGYMIIDHKHKRVLKGGAVLALKELLDFRSAEERLGEIDALIADMLLADEYITTREINAKLRRQFNTKITKDGITWGEEVHHLPEAIMKQLQRNDKLSWLQSFCPSSDAECAILYKFGKMDEQRGLQLRHNDERHVKPSVGRVRKLMEDIPTDSLRSKLFESGIRVYRYGGEYYCLDTQHHCIYNMENQGLDVNILNAAIEQNRQQLQSQLQSTHSQQQGLQQSIGEQQGSATKQLQAILPALARSSSSVGRSINNHGGSQDQNREDEVGTHEGYEASIANRENGIGR